MDKSGRLWITCSIAASEGLVDNPPPPKYPPLPVPVFCALRGERALTGKGLGFEPTCQGYESRTRQFE